MPTPHYDLSRFISAQETVYQTALSEIKRGRKQSHWMWFIFPQIKGLGKSDTAQYYSITNIDEASAYLSNPIPGPRLTEISGALLDLQTKSAYQIFGSPDDMKLRSCMTLFSAVENTSPIFSQILDKYFSGQPDEQTLSLLTI